MEKYKIMISEIEKIVPHLKKLNKEELIKVKNEIKKIIEMIEK